MAIRTAHLDQKPNRTNRRPRQTHRRLRGTGSMHWRILGNVPFPAVFGDVVTQVSTLAKAVGALRSPKDTRWHAGVKLSENTAHRRRQVWHAAAKFWKSLDRTISLRRIRREHVWALIGTWKDQGTGPGTGRRMSGATVANKLVHLRALEAFARLETHSIVPSTAEVLRYMEREPRVFFDGRDKSLEGNRVDFWDVHERANALDPRVATVFALAWLLGFRIEEAMKWRPHVDFSEAGSRAFIQVIRGPKNGQARKFEVRRDAQLRIVVTLAKRYASAGTGGLIPDGSSEKAFRERIYRVAKKVRLTRKGLGVTPHGLRHSFARRRYRDELARLGVWEGQRPRPEEDRAARLVVSECLGHHRVGITACYLGKPDQPSPR